MLDSISVNTPPTVTLLSPNGGEPLGGARYRVAWESSDLETPTDKLTHTLLYSTDDGVTWQRRGLLPADVYAADSVTFQPGAIVIVAMGLRAETYVLRSHDDGATWAEGASPEMSPGSTPPSSSSDACSSRRSTKARTSGSLWTARSTWRS